MSVLAWQEALWRNMMRDGSVRGHAMLLKGRQGIGKLTYARFLAKSLLCRQPGVDYTACGRCDSCNWFVQHTHPNFMLIAPEALVGEPATEGAEQSRRRSSGKSADSASSSDAGDAGDSKAAKKASQIISIHQIRALDDFVYLSGHQTGLKIILIHPAEAMNHAAANALLKKLEEPPEQVLFILVSHQPQRLPATVRSRCQQIAMPLPDQQTALHWLTQHAPLQQPASAHQPEQVQQSQQAQPSQQWEELLALSGYSPFKALWFEDGYAQHQQLIDAVSRPRQFDPIATAEKLQGRDLTQTVDGLQRWCYDVLAFAATRSIRYHPRYATRIEPVCECIDIPALIDYLRFLNTQQSLARHPLQARLFLENIFIRYRTLFDRVASE